MGVLIDSTVLVDMERKAGEVSSLIRGREEEEAYVSVISASELLHGVHRLTGARRARTEVLVERLLARLPAIPFDLGAARVHATLSADLRVRGTPVGAHDLLIAATAVLIDYQVATRDLRSFPRIRGLRVLRW